MEKLFFIGLISGMIGAIYTGLTLSIKPIYLFAGIFVAGSLSIGAHVESGPAAGKEGWP